MHDLQGRSSSALSLDLPPQGRIIVSGDDLAPRGGGEPIRDKFGDLRGTVEYIHPDAPSDQEHVSHTTLKSCVVAAARFT